MLIFHPWEYIWGSLVNYGREEGCVGSTECLFHGISRKAACERWPFGHQNMAYSWRLEECMRSKCCIPLAHLSSRKPQVYSWSIELSILLYPKPLQPFSHILHDHVFEDSAKVSDRPGVCRSSESCRQYHTASTQSRGTNNQLLKHRFWGGGPYDHL